MSIAFAACSFATVRGELPSPKLDRLEPLGATAGTSVELEIGGGDLEELKTLAFDHAGIKAEPIAGKEKEKRFTVTIAADVPEGTYDCRAIGLHGVSNPRLFEVTRGLTDLAEKEPNNDFIAAQTIALNTAVNGKSDGNDQDVFRLELKQGERITLDCRSSRLDVPLDAVLLLLAGDGRQLASSGDYYGRDPFIDFQAPSDGEYFAVIHDLSYRGGLAYRLVVSNRPHVENVFPRAVQIGKPIEVTAFGRNLGGSSAANGTLQEAKLSLAIGSDAVLGAYRFLEHPTAHSVAPTAATCTLAGFQFRPEFGGSAAQNAQIMLLSETPVAIEAEPNDSSEKPQAVELPLMLSGRFDTPRDADWYEFSVPENGSYALDVYCERIAGQADPYVVFQDEKGNRFQEFDDFGRRQNGFDGHIRDCSGNVNLNAKQKYRVLVQDRYRRGGPRYQYVLSLRKSQPEFYVAAMHHQNPGPGGTTLRAGSAVYYDLICHPADNYQGSITVTAENLPAGVHARPTSFPAGQQGALVLWADADAAEFEGPIKLTATGKRGEETIVREVRAYTRVWSDNPSSSRPMRSAFIAVRKSAPFSLTPAAETITIEQGKKQSVQFSLARLQADFTNQVALLPLAFPNQIKANLPQIAAGANEASVEFEVQANAAPGEYTLAILGQAQVPYRKDPAKGPENTLVTLPSRPITIVVPDPPPKP